MNVIYWSRSKKKTSLTKVSLDKLVSTADFIFVTVALNEGTKNILNKNLLAKMKGTASLVSNVSEEIYDHKFLLSQAKKGNVWGYAFETDKHKSSDFEGNVFAIPAYAWYTSQSIQNDYRIWTDTILSICGGKPINVVN